MASLNGNLLLNFTRHEHQHFLTSEVGSDSMCKQLEPKVLRTDATAPIDDELNSALPESKSSDEADDVFADAYESPKDTSPSTSSYIPEDDVALERRKLSPDKSFDFVHQLGDRNMVLVCPDYIIYQGRYSTESVLYFSKEGMRLEDSTTHRDQQMSRSEWEIADIVDIQSQWSNRLEVAIVKLHFLFKGDGDFSEVEEMQFAVAEVNWPEKREEIMSLDVRYKDVWRVVVDNETEISGTTGESIWRKSYFPNFAEFSDEIIYPKCDPDAVSISRRDVGLLQPDIFVNDTIIDFYIKFLKNQLPIEDRNRFHFFNSFFFRKLIDLDKDPPSSFECKSAFQRVRKWTRKVNLFEKDYVFIPVNYSYHWSLVIICHPGEVIKFEDDVLTDEDKEKALKVPCILHMDSLKGSHTVLKNIIQSYLWEEWKEKNKDPLEDISPRFLNLRFISLELPQQPNAFDCGLFLLHYVERFLEEAPMDFSPWKITNSSKFLNLDWFRPEEPCLKRAHVQRLISKILKGENPENSVAAFCGKPCALDYRACNNASETNLELDSKGYSSSKNVHGNLSGPQSSDGIEITLLKMSSSQHGDSSLVLKEFMGVESGQYQTFDQVAAFGAMGNMEDDVEVCKEFVYTPSNLNPDSGVPCISNDLETDGNKTDHNDFEEYRQKSGGSGYSSEVEIHENKRFENTIQVGERINETRSPLAENPTSPPNQMLDVADFEPRDKILNSHGKADNDLGSFKPHNVLQNGEDGMLSSEKIGKADTSEQLGSETVSEFLFPENDGGQGSETDGTLGLEKIGYAETSEQQGSETVSEFVVSETGGRQGSETVSKILVSETDGMLDVEKIDKAGTRERQSSETVSEFLVSETDGRQGSETVSKILLSETDGMLGLEKIGMAETSEQRGSETVSEFLFPETDGKELLVPKTDGNSESDGQLVAKRNSDDVLPESCELQPAKRPRLESSPNAEM